MASDLDLLIARLSGTARRLAIEGCEHQVALERLRAIAQGPHRAQALAMAAGTAMARYRHAPEVNVWERPCADLLLAAGVDLAKAELEATEVTQRLVALTAHHASTQTNQHTEDSGGSGPAGSPAAQSDRGGSPSSTG